MSAFLYTGGPATIPLLGTKFVLYSALPWLALMALGFSVGHWFLKDSAARAKLLIRVGLAAATAFILLRATNLYGNPVTMPGSGVSGLFETGPDFTRSLMSFLNAAKYPAYLQFSLMTLGPLLIPMGYLVRYDAAGGMPRWMRPFHVIGRVPFYFYVLHLYLIHGLALLAATITAQPTQYLLWNVRANIIPPDGYGYGNGSVLLIWVAVVAVLYPLCIWFEHYKKAHDAWWLKHL